jgi:hypothetical protein
MKGGQYLGEVNVVIRVKTVDRIWCPGLVNGKR